MKKIAVIGPGNISASSELYRFGTSLGSELSRPDRVIICGGLGGFMEAVCKGVKSSPATFSGQTIGILPGEKSSAANPFIDVAIPTGMGIARNIIIINTADIVIAAGGGSGTLSELAFAWQKGKKVLCITSFGGWAEELAGKNVDERAVGLFVKVKNVDEILVELGDVRS